MVNDDIINALSKTPDGQRKLYELIRSLNIRTLPNPQIVDLDSTYIIGASHTITHDTAYRAFMPDQPLTSNDIKSITPLPLIRKYGYATQEDYGAFNAFSKHGTWNKTQDNRLVGGYGFQNEREAYLRLNAVDQFLPTSGNIGNPFLDRKIVILEFIPRQLSQTPQPFFYWPTNDLILFIGPSRTPFYTGNFTADGLPIAQSDIYNLNLNRKYLFLFDYEESTQRLNISKYNEAQGIHHDPPRIHSIEGIQNADINQFDLNAHPQFSTRINNQTTNINATQSDNQIDYNLIAFMSVKNGHNFTTQNKEELLRKIYHDGIIDYGTNLDGIITYRLGASLTSIPT